LLLVQPLARFGQETRSGRSARQRIEREQQTAAIGAVQRHLPAAHAGDMPTARVQKANPKIGIVVQKQRVVRVRLGGHALEGRLAQVRRARVGPPRQHEAPFDAPHFLAVLVEQEMLAAQRQITQMVRFQIEIQVTVQFLTVAAVLVGAANDAVEGDAGMTPFLQSGQLLQAALQRAGVDAVEVGQLADGVVGRRPALADANRMAGEQARQSRREHVGTDQIDLAPQQRSIRRERHFLILLAQYDQTPHFGTQRVLLRMSADAAAKVGAAAQANRFADETVLSDIEDSFVVFNGAGAADA
jgi:hypothetical protein